MAKHPPVPTFEKLKDEYTRLFAEAKIVPHWRDEAEGAAQAIIDARPKLEPVALKTGVPWQVLGMLQMMEAGVYRTKSGIWKLNFGGHLHNGDPLTDRTKQVPKGRPPMGQPPFSWEESALDAVKYDGLDKEDWTECPTEKLLYRAESYNGWGYRQYHPNVLSPYLWSGTFHYKRGKYISDGGGGWSDSAVSGQIGVAPVMKALEARGEWIKPREETPIAFDPDWTAAVEARNDSLKPREIAAAGSRSMTMLDWIWMKWKVATAGFTVYEGMKFVSDGKDTISDVLSIVERHAVTLVGLLTVSTVIMVLFGRHFLAEAARDGRYVVRQRDEPA